MNNSTEPPTEDSGGDGLTTENIITIFAVGFSGIIAIMSMVVTYLIHKNNKRKEQLKAARGIWNNYKTNGYVLNQLAWLFTADDYEGVILDLNGFKLRLGERVYRFVSKGDASHVTRLEQTYIKATIEDACEVLVGMYDLIQQELLRASDVRKIAGFLLEQLREARKHHDFIRVDPYEELLEFDALCVKLREKEHQKKGKKHQQEKQDDGEDKERKETVVLIDGIIHRTKRGQLRPSTQQQQQPQRRKPDEGRGCASSDSGGLGGGGGRVGKQQQLRQQRAQQQQQHDHIPELETHSQDSTAACVVTV